ncbi:MAG: hypothetical protein HOB64_20945 [Rhodospirillaceae bacterium]|nr:hypothetical protein [Rhodospirillaceae bacterium]MBT4674596.1 hypothetical protein [Rhodospirillaceae bacterium]MBT5180254.1 hypothetical protein [Rhodospirillaceae bacterium]
MDDADGAFNGTSLENAIRASLAVREEGVALSERYKLRVWERAAGNSDNLFINHYHDAGTLVFGDVIHFSHGHMQAAFDASEDDAVEVDVTQLALDEEYEYIHSLLYWMVKGQHVFVVQSQSLRANALEGYFCWLLGIKSGVVAPLAEAGSQLILAHKFDRAVVGGDIDDIEEIIIGGVPAMSAPVVEGVENSAVREVVQEDEVRAGAADDRNTVDKVLLALLGSRKRVEEKLRQVPEDVELSVKVHLGLRSKKRRVEKRGLREFEVGLRNLDDAEIAVKGKDGALSADGRIRLQHPAQVACAGSLLDAEDVLRAMREAYQVFIDNGKIQP